MVFSLEQAVLEKLPNLCVGLVVASGIDNACERPEVSAFLGTAVRDAEKSLEGINASEDERVQPYRAAFSALGMSPSRYPSSNIALLRRIAKGKGVWRVNPLVDLGNAVSIAYGLPLGVHALDLARETLELRFSRQGDHFVELGKSEADPTLAPGELVYAVGDLVQTRRWTWRQSESGKVVPETREVVIPIDGFRDVNEDAVRAACDELAVRLRDIFGATVSTHLADADCPCV
ncbi:MAG: phenylalanine--tRNA ligase beta subunit-related protein [Coriobacteriales bacterium]|nr:phenylalanine--tRNA ligase beta subunit-related protein [Coriobacteriales bacterium]